MLSFRACNSQRWPYIRIPRGAFKKSPYPRGRGGSSESSPGILLCSQGRDPLFEGCVRFSSLGSLRCLVLSPSG